MGSLDAHWDPGAKTCPVSQTDPIQVHRYDAQTIILREKLCSTWEAPFMYQLIGNKQALLIDTGDIADPKLSANSMVSIRNPGGLSSRMACGC